MNKKRWMIIAGAVVALVLIGIIAFLMLRKDVNVPETQPTGTTGTTSTPTSTATQPTTAPTAPTTQPHEHNYEEQVVQPNCTEGGYKLFTCSCGETYTDEETSALGHSFKNYVSNGDATCSADGTKTAKCDRCGESKTVADTGSALNHSYEKQIKEATCTEGGCTVFTCSACGSAYTDEETPALGHNFGAYTSNGDATCTADGTKTAICDRCGENKTVTDAGTALGHAYVKQSKEATCTEGGCSVYTCANCKDVYTDDETPALGHSYTNYVSNGDATCTSDGTKTAKCDRCDEVKTIADSGSALGHAYAKQVKEATCVTGGFTVNTCTVCGDSYTNDEAPALGHSFTSYVSNGNATCTSDGTKTAKCDRCDESKTVVDSGSALGHAYTKQVTEATCIVGGYATYSCSACGDTYTDDEVPALGHSFTNYVSNSDATCTSDGTQTAKCDRCDETKTLTDVGSALGHSYEKNTTPATCTSGGYTTYTCSVCGYSYQDDETPATGHAWSDWTTVEEPTEETEGKRERHCANCDAREEGTIAKLPASHKHSYEENVIAPTCTENGYSVFTCACGDAYRANETAALGHSFTNYVSNGDATCTSDGTKTAKCDRCDESKTVADSGSAMGHSYGEQITAATCVSGGYTTFTCTACGDTYIDDETAALGHSFTNYVSNGDATCTADGTKTAKCDRCDETKTIANPGSALGHDYDQQVTEATCTEIGYTTYTCSACGNYYTDDEISALGHSFTNYVSNGDATCTADGTKTAKCDRCDETKTIADDGSKMGHSYAQWITNPTCTTDGYTTYICAVCDDTYTDDEVPALGHSFTNYVSNGDATCTADGTKTAKCDRCKEKKTIVDSGSALSHSYEMLVTDPTCTTDGYTTYTCSVCGNSYTDDEVPAFGHSFTIYMSNGDATCTADGTKTAVCDECAETKTIPDDGSARGHAYNKLVTSATCIENGYTTYECSVCGDSYQDNEVPALGHSFTNYVSNGDATCTADGTKTAKCDRCEETKTIPDADSMTDHTYEEKVTSATCTENGYITFTCAACGDTFVEDGALSLGHSFTNYISNADATCTADGTKTAKCDRCDETKTITDAGTALGHSFGEWVTTQEPTDDAMGKKTRTCETCGFTEEADVPMDNVTYEDYLNMTPEEQQAFFMSFPSYVEFMQWFEAAKAAYDEENQDIEIGGDGNIDIGDIIGGLG